MNNKYTSLELSKKLAEAGCELETNFFYDDKWDKHYKINLYQNRLKYPVYDILNDICVKYAKEFFGEDKNKLWIYEYVGITANILRATQDWKYIEDYIWDNCNFNQLINKLWK